MAYAFGTQGATPQNSQSTLDPRFSSTGSTPASRALNSSVGMPKLSSTLPSTGMGVTQSTTPMVSSKPLDLSHLAVTSGLIPKSQTITNTDGSSHTVTFHPANENKLVMADNPYYADDKSKGTSGNAMVNVNAQNIPVTDKNGQTTYVSGTSDALPDALIAAGGGASKTPTPGTSDTISTQQPSPSFQGLVGKVVDNAQSAQTNPLVKAAEDKYMQNAQEIGPALANVTNTPGILANQNARASNLTQAYGAEQQGLSAGINAALAPIDQTQTGLLGALGQTKPELGSYGQTYYQPLNSAQGGAGGAGVSPTDPFYATLQSYAKMAANGQYDAIPSSITSNSVLSSQLNDMAKQINPNYNPIVSKAQGAAASTNIQTGSTAAIQAAATGLQNATQNYVSANTAYTTATNQAGNLQQAMSTTGVNTSGSQYLNSKINTLQNQFGSTKYPAFITALNEAKQAYTSLLSSVGAATPTVNGQQATDIFNENSTPAQISAAIDALNTAAYAKLKPLYDQIGTYASQLNGNQSGSQSNNQSGGGSGAFSDSSFYGK